MVLADQASRAGSRRIRLRLASPGFPELLDLG
jgi:hypothetical protein